MHVLMYISKLQIIQSYEQVLGPMGSDKRGPTVLALHYNIHFRPTFLALVLLVLLNTGKSTRSM